MKIDNRDEKELVARIIKKDEKSLMFVYRIYRQPIFNFIKKQLGDSGVAEEITQDVFLEFIEALRDFHFQCSLKTYIFSIARNKTIDTIRKKKIKKIFFSSMPSYFLDNIASVVFDEKIERQEVRSKIKKTFSKLPNDYRLILRLKYIENHTVRGISKKLVIGFKATESLLFRARKAFIKVFNSLP